MKVLQRLVCLAAILILSSCYYLTQGTALLGLHGSAKPIEEYLKDQTIGQAEKKFLEEAVKIRTFAMDELGLKKSANYSVYARTERKYLAMVVSACASDSFKTYYWDYPFMGPLPYKGFFDEKDAQAEVDRLKKEGLDVLARKVDAFSTLGILTDPLFSFMADYSIGELAELIIHEQTHATVFLKNQSQFNEEFATFSGEQGAILYMKKTYGEDSEPLKTYLAGKRDSQKFVKLLSGLAQDLDQAYSLIQDKTGRLEAKKRIIESFAEKYKTDYSKTFEGEGYKNFDPSRINNAFLDLYRLYRGRNSLFEDYYAKVCGSDYHTFIAKIKDISEKFPDAAEEMKKQVEAVEGN